MRNFWRKVWCRLTGHTWVPRIRYEIRTGFGVDRSMRTYTNQPPTRG